MKWLLTVPAEVEDDRLARELTGWECEREEGKRPIPSQDGGRTLRVEGPEDLPERIERSELRDQVEASPNSEMTYYPGLQ